MRTITLNNPGKWVFGTGCFSQFITDFKSLGKKRLYILTIPLLAEMIRQEMDSFAAIGIPADAIPEMAASAVKIERLMKNNIRTISVGDAIEIYQNAY